MERLPVAGKDRDLRIAERGRVMQRASLDDDDARSVDDARAS